MLNTIVYYTCPMHPQIHQNTRGTCPQCGMALEYEDISNIHVIQEEHNELDYMSQRFYISLFLSFPVFIVAMLSDVIPSLIPNEISTRDIQIFEFLFATPVVLWAGLPFFTRAYTSVKTLHLNMFTLISIGIGSAYIYSLFALTLPHIFPPLMQDENGYVHLYFEAAAVITTLVLLGQVLELQARSKTNSAIKTLLNLAPKKARKVNSDASEEEIELINVHLNDTLKVKPGEKIPVDAYVIKGESNVDESMITGEALPVRKTINDKVIGATINKNGTLLIKAEKIGNDTMLSQIVNMVAQAQRSRAPIQKLADTISAYFVPLVIFSSLVTFFGWWIIGPQPQLAYALVASVTVLIIACPCALGLATPISIMVGTGRAALMGILIKDAQTLETMEKVDTLLIDKTGTLTLGKPQVTQILFTNGTKEKELIQLVASLENASEHPLAEALTSYASTANISLLSIDNFEAITGKGITGEVNGRSILIGSDTFLADSGTNPYILQAKTTELRQNGQTLIFVAIDAKLSAIIAISDPIKETAKEAIKELQKGGIHVVMLSGDNTITANIIAQKLAITEVYANIMPQEKAAFIKKFQKEGKVVAMAGDGINDAPALAQADVGIAMGNGTDVAIQSAGITLIKGDLLGIVKVKKLSIATMKNIRQNLFFAFFYNSAGIPIAAGLLYPFFGILLSPIIAAAAMSFSSVSVILNALRLKNIKI